VASHAADRGGSLALLNGHRLIAVDTETTGLSPADGDTLVEVATVTITDAATGETWSSLMRPGRAIPADAAAVHGITDAMVAEAPAPAIVAAELRGRCGDLPLVFHNASFDLPFLIGLLRQTGQPPLLNPIVDTLGLARGLGGTGGNSLGALAARFGLAKEPQHRALGDALTTARLFLELASRWEQERGVRTLAELAAVSQDLMRQTATR
jgi:DNA polymerase-3 subunit epsilon